jgi:hypothetical protein
MTLTEANTAFETWKEAVDIGTLPGKKEAVPQTLFLPRSLSRCRITEGSLNRGHCEGHDLRNVQHAIFPSGDSVRLDPEKLSELHLSDPQCRSSSFQRFALHWTSNPTCRRTKRSIRKVYGDFLTWLYIKYRIMEPRSN